MTTRRPDSGTLAASTALARWTEPTQRRERAGETQRGWTRSRRASTHNASQTPATAARSACLRTFACASVLVSLTTAPLVAQTGSLFSQPFVVEHHMVQRDGDGTVFYGQNVTDYYGGSWIVSVRPDESRMVVDLAGRMLTEIRPERGTYWRVSFDRLAELRQRFLSSELGKDELRALGGAEPRDDRTPAGTEDLAAVKASAETLPELVVTEVSAPQAGDESAGLTAVAAPLRTKAGVRYLQVGREGGEPELKVWVDPSVRMSPAARRALESFESTALGGSPRQGAASPAVATLVAAARDHADGAIPVHTLRSMPKVSGGTIEDVTTRLEPLPSFPLDLVQVPDGFEQVAHPLELLLALVDDEAGREALLGNPVQP